ncbi:MAG: phosphoglycerate kinase [Rikenellaceae bacterium]|nr:phosphoglycerate kinase [Rikenellaceae bacterium]
MQSIENYPFKGKRALIRVDFNVPMNDAAEVTDDTRIRAAIPTIKKVLAEGGSIVLLSHMGRPKDGPSEKLSLKQIIPTIEKNLDGHKVLFGGDCMGEQAAEMSKNLKEGEILLLDNLRFYKEEEKGNEEFARRLASFGDCYINDAFGTAHRRHASTAVIADFFPNDKMFGYVMEGEINAIDKVLKNPQRPFTAILGGSKISSKITVIENLLTKVDNLIIGGGMTFTFMAAQGGKVGSSLCEPDQFETALRVIARAKELGVNLVQGVDALCGDRFAADADQKTFSSMDIPEGWMGLDAGPEAIKDFDKVIMESKTILWNGPVGVFEFDRFSEGSRAVSESIVKATEQGAYSLIGGGDSVACINKFGLADKVSYVSTGGGALLEYMEGVELPGVAAIRG